MSQRQTGIIIPLLSLSHKGDYGVGDLTSLRKLIPWAAETGVNFLQLPNINEKGSEGKRENSISSIALDPVYLDLERIPELSANDLIQNAPQEEVDQKWARHHKDQVLRKAFLSFSEHKVPNEDFLAFQQTEAEWLSTYSLFRFLMTVEDQNADWTNWRTEYNNTEKAFDWLEERLTNHADTIYPEILYYEWLQWHSHKQWREIRELAESHELKLMSTLPYHLPLNSADVFFQQEIFHLDAQSSSPAFNIDHLERTDFRWWRRRLEKHTDLFSLSLIYNTAEDKHLLHLLKGYPDTEFIWDSLEPHSHEVATELNKQEQLLPFYCIQEGKNASVLPTENFPYSSYSTLTTEENLSTEKVWIESRKILENVSNPSRNVAINTITFLAEISRTPLPHIVKHALDIPRFEKKMQWGVIDYHLKTNSRYTALSLTDLLYTVDQLPKKAEHGRLYLVDLFSAHKGLRALQKELRLRIKLLRSSPARGHNTLNP